MSQSSGAWTKETQSISYVVFSLHLIPGDHGYPLRLGQLWRGQLAYWRGAGAAWTGPGECCCTGQRRCVALCWPVVSCITWHNSTAYHCQSTSPHQKNRMLDPLTPTHTGKPYGPGSIWFQRCKEARTQFTLLKWIYCIANISQHTNHLI